MAPLRDFEYSPWLTANLTLERIPEHLWKRSHLGQRFYGFAHTRLRRRDAPDSAHSRGPDGLDLLLGTRRWIASQRIANCC